MAWNRRWQALPNRWRSCVSFTVRGALPGDPVSITNMTDAPEHASEPEHASILHRTAAGAVWLVGWRMCTRALGIISTLVLVRLHAETSDFWKTQGDLLAKTVGRAAGVVAAGGIPPFKQT